MDVREGAAAGVSPSRWKGMGRLRTSEGRQRKRFFWTDRELALQRHEHRLMYGSDMVLPCNTRGTQLLDPCDPRLFCYRFGYERRAVRVTALCLVQVQGGCVSFPVPCTRVGVWTGAEGRAAFGGDSGEKKWPRGRCCSNASKYSAGGSRLLLGVAASIALSVRAVAGYRCVGHAAGVRA